MKRRHFSKKCRSCGRLVRDGAAFCLDCGEPLNGVRRRRGSSARNPDSDGGATQEHEVAPFLEAVSSGARKGEPRKGEPQSELDPGHSPGDRLSAGSDFLVLKVCRGLKRREECILGGKGEFLIGRSIESDLILRDRTVSRRHAAIFRTDRGWKIRDLGSANGTYVNGRKTSESAIGPGDIVIVGKATLLVSS